MIIKYFGMFITEIKKYFHKFQMVFAELIKKLFSKNIDWLDFGTYENIKIWYLDLVSMISVNRRIYLHN